MFYLGVGLAEPIAVIVNEKSALLSEGKSTLELKEVKDIYLGKQKFWKNSLLKPVNQKDKEVLGQFLKKACEMTISNYQYHWLKMELEEAMASPKVIEGKGDIIRYLQNEETAIAYVWENEARDISGIKIVLLLSE